MNITAPVWVFAVNDMTKGNPSTLIIRFAIPILLGNLLQLTYSLCDTRIVGSFLGESALAAVGSTTVINSLIIGFLNGMANGFAITTAQRFGAKNEKGVRRSFLASLLMGFGISLVLMTVGLLGLKPMLTFLNVPVSLRTVAGSYIRIIIAGMIITMFYDILMAVMRGIGDSVTPLIFLGLSVFLNIGGDILLIVVFHTGVWGAAAATVAAQVIALIICAIVLYRKHHILRIQPGDLSALSRGMLWNMFLTGLSMGLMSSLINLGSLVLQTAINELGEEYIIAQTAARKLTELLMMVFIVIGHTLTTFCGQNYGAGRYDRIRAGMKVGLIYTISWCGIVLVLAYTICPTLLRMITGDVNPVIIEYAARYLRIDTILYFIVAIIFVMRNSLQGIGDRVTPLISSGIEMVGKFILAATLVPRMGYMGVILTEPIVWVVMVIPLVVKMLRHPVMKERHLTASARE